jgi:hypothetical protein
MVESVFEESTDNVLSLSDIASSDDSSALADAAFSTGSADRYAHDKSDT